MPRHDRQLGDFVNVTNQFRVGQLLHGAQSNPTKRNFGYLILGVLS